MTTPLTIMQRGFPKVSKLLTRRTYGLEKITIDKNVLKFSIIAPAIRKNQYKRIYDFLKTTNEVPFEIVFVGPNPPDDPIADNFRYIVSDVKCAQCLEIAARRSLGEYLIIIGDDYEFSDGFLDGLNFYISCSNLSNSLVGYNYTLSGEFYRSLLILDKRVKNTPICAGGAVYKRSVWYELGGIDRRFTGGMCNLDMQLRFQEMGYSLFIAPDIFANEIREEDSLNSSLWSRTGKHGQQLCHQLWIDGNKVVTKRKLPVESFSDEGILEKNQS